MALKSALLKRCPFSLHSVNSLSTVSKRYIFLGDLPTFDKNPSIHLNLTEYDSSIDILTLSHWVDIQYFEQNKIASINGECYNSLNEWLNDNHQHLL